MRQQTEQDPDAYKAWSEMEAAFDNYVTEEEKIHGIGERDLSKQFPCDGPLQQTVADIAPLPPMFEILSNSSKTSSLPVLQIVSAGGCGGCGTTSGGCCQ